MTWGGSLEHLRSSNPYFYLLLVFQYAPISDPAVCLDGRCLCHALVEIVCNPVILGMHDKQLSSIPGPSFVLRDECRNSHLISHIYAGGLEQLLYSSSRAPKTAQRGPSVIVAAIPMTACNNINFLNVRRSVSSYRLSSSVTLRLGIIIASPGHALRYVF